jgi:hypothetical protein
MKNYERAKKVFASILIDFLKEYHDEIQKGEFNPSFRTLMHYTEKWMEYNVKIKSDDK